MIRRMNKKSSIYYQLFLLLVGSAVVAGLVFIAADRLGIYMVDRYYYASDYEGKKNASYIKQLQKYVDGHQLASDDSVSLKRWVKKQKVISLWLYKDGELVFNSEYPEEEFEPGEQEDGRYYTVSFSDGTANAVIWGMYDYQLYNYELVTVLAASYMLFLALVLLGIRKKIAYILKLRDEIEILESGSLDYSITVKGTDEMAALAEGLDSMRVSLLRLMEQEAQLVAENQRIVTEMSHDLRTPVTAILLYTEILKMGKYRDERQLAEYLDKIDRRARRMKQLTDHLFAYSLTSSGEPAALEPAESYTVLFYDLLSETCSYLEQRGFQTALDVAWSDQNVRICTEMVGRVIDNITSNIVKYGDPAEPVKIGSVYETNLAGFSFANRVRETEETEQSTGVGLQSIRNLMRRMGGACRVSERDGTFWIEVLFRTV